MREGGDIADTFKALNQSVQDFDKLIADPNIQRILAASASTSEHLADSSESVEIALRPWRKKANQLKMVVTKLLGMLKIVYTL
jgi:hypothetical protein